MTNSCAHSSSSSSMALKRDEILVAVKEANLARAKDGVTMESLVREAAKSAAELERVAPLVGGEFVQQRLARRQLDGEKGLGRRQGVRQARACARSRVRVPWG